MSLLISVAFIYLMNNKVVNDYSKTIKIIIFRWQYGVVMVLLTIIVNLIISYGSLYKAVSKNPVDVIRLK